jgi:transposase-like protein
MDKYKKHFGPKFRVRYAEEFKHQVCREYLSGNYTKTELQDKYGIKGKSRLLSWLHELGYIQFTHEKGFVMMKKEKKTKNSELSPEQVKDLGKALRDAELKAAAYCKMIELAEKQYNIKIRKNLNTK